jgi:Mg-chelatase subunit ChlD
MRCDRERRLRAAETPRIGPRAAEVWIVLSDGMLRGPHGEMMTAEEFDAALPGKGTVVVLPDNGRDRFDRGVIEIV